MERDFLIIGGGIAGASAGHALSALGTVELWEAEEAPAYHASGRSAALFEERYGLAPVVALNRASRADHEAAGWMSPRGLMLVGVEGEEDEFTSDAKNLGLTAITLDDAQTRVPVLSQAVTRAAFHGDAFDLDTGAMVQAGLRAVAKVRLDCRADTIEAVPGGWHVRAGKVEVTARNVVNAAGPWADGVAELAGVRPLGLTPLRRSMARIAAPGGADVRAWPMMLGVAERWYAKPDAWALLVSPAEEDPAEPMDAWPDDMVLAEGLARWQAAAEPEVTRPIASWAGLRTFTPDRCLALGASERPGFWWCAGQGGYGFQTAPAAARLLADLVAGRASELDAATVAALSPGRFA